LRWAWGGVGGEGSGGGVVAVGGRRPAEVDEFSSAGGKVEAVDEVEGGGVADGQMRCVEGRDVQTIGRGDGGLN